MNKTAFLVVLVLFFIFRFIFGFALDLYLIPFFAILILRSEIIKDHYLLIALGVSAFLFAQSLILPIFCTFVIIGIFDIVKQLIHKNEILLYIAASIGIFAFKFMENALWSLKINGNIVLPQFTSVLVPVVTGTIGGIILLLILRRYERKAIKAGHI